MNFATEHLSANEANYLKRQAEQEAAVRPDWKQSDHHRNMMQQALNTEADIHSNYKRYLDLLSDYEQKKLTAAIQQGTRFNLGNAVPWVDRSKIPFPASFTCFYFIQRGAVFAECSGQIAFVEWIEIPAKSAASKVMQLQSGLHSIGNIRQLLKDIWGTEWFSLTIKRFMVSYQMNSAIGRL